MSDSKVITLCGFHLYLKLPVDIYKVELTQSQARVKTTTWRTKILHTYY